MGFWDWLMGTPPTERTVPAGRTPSSTQMQRRASVFGIEVGDVVSYDLVDYIVKNKLTYEEEGFYWYDYLLVDEPSGQELWLSAEDDDGISIGIFREIELDGIPPVPGKLTHDGKSFRQTEHSHASVRLEREDAARDTENGRVEYWDFEGPNDTYLSILKWGGSYEASVGHEIGAHELTIYPANLA